MWLHERRVGREGIPGLHVEVVAGVLPHVEGQAGLSVEEGPYTTRFEEEGLVPHKTSE